MQINIIGIRLCPLRNLIFFSLLFLSACAKKKTESIRLIWNNEQVTGISIPRDLVKTISDSLERRVVVCLAREGEPVPMFGNYKISDDEILFEPLVPFTSGLRYQVLIDHRIADEIVIPPPDSTKAPVLLKIYPTKDTVPENLLKIYLRFSRPMREGQSISHLTVLKNERDTMRGVFLDLQPELWNDDRTMLTVWLDPGRIKRGLQPNTTLGAPLQRGAHYTLVISHQWKDIQGAALGKDANKKFMVTGRDSLPPDPKTWLIHNPKAGTTGALDIDLKSPLDFSLLNSALHVVNGKGSDVLGQWQIGDEERKASFIPQSPWSSGNYELLIETRLEDLAGNNLNRAFDVDVRAKAKRPAETKTVVLPFSVKP